MNVSAGIRAGPCWACRIGILAGLYSLFVAMCVPLPSVSAIAEPFARERPVYVTNADSADISAFSVDVVTGRPTLVGSRTKAGEGVRQLAFTPDARHAYAANSDANTTSAYAVGPRGVLTPLPGGAGTVDSRGDTPVGTVVSPNGRTLYIAHVFQGDPNGGTIAIFRIASKGDLKPLGSPITTTEPHPRGLAITPDGRFLYAGHGDPGPGRNNSVGAITAYAINSDGAITPIGSPIRVGRFCGDSAITPDGRRLYVVCQDFDQIFGFAIGSDGGLTPLTGSPYLVTGEFPETATPSPDGRFIFVASPGRTTDGSVSAFSVGADGALTEVPGSPYPGGFGPVGIATLPNGKFVYASADVDSGPDDLGALNAYMIGPSGTLKPLPGSPFLTGGKGPAYGSFAVLPNQGPVARFIARDGGSPSSANFDASTSTDPDGRIARYLWDFGDGTNQTTVEPQTTHVYSRPGRFRVNLVVIDDEGCSTALISVGKAILCNGTAAAATSRIITVGE